MANGVGGMDDYLKYTITGDLAQLGISDFNDFSVSWHWAMTNGNDTVEGTFEPASVPEPATISLLGFGFTGIILSRRRKSAATLNKSTADFNLLNGE